MVVLTASASDAATVAPVPLVVDLDGTLVASDLLAESLFLLIKRKPLRALAVLPVLLHGRAALQRAVAHDVVPDAATLPYDRDVLAVLASERSQGRRIVLAGGADLSLATAVADHLGLFDEVLANDQLTEAFGVDGFELAHAVERPLPGWRVWLRALRPHHWLKNALVFLPLAAAQRLAEPAPLAHAALAFVTMCLCASAVYLLNDLFDIDEDRHHPRKKARALAAGILPIGRAAALIPLLLAAGLLLALAQPPEFPAIVLVYCALMFFYCLRLRAVAGWDTAALGVGYTLRIAAGGAATGVPLSPTLLLAAPLYFTGLALLKRHAEMLVLQQSHGDTARVRAYPVAHRRHVTQAGVVLSAASLLIAAIGLTLRAPPPEVTALASCAFAVLCAWTVHIWRKAWRGHIQGDPVTFALHDRTSRLLGLVFAALVLAMQR